MFKKNDHLANPVHRFIGTELTICHDEPELPWPENVYEDYESLCDYLNIPMSDWPSFKTDPYYPQIYGKVDYIHCGDTYNKIMDRILNRARELHDPDMDKIIAYFDSKKWV
jgi:hypothetical protein